MGISDVFKEQIVKKKETTMDRMKRIGLILAVIIIFFVVLATPAAQFVAIIVAAAGFGAFYLMNFLRVEYEYIFTNGELDIDIIYNRSRRKRLFSSHVNKIEIMAHVEDMNHAGSFSGAQEICNYSSGENGPDTYAFLINQGGKMKKVIIEPNEKMLKAISGSMSRTKLHLKR
ncbi:MAG: DUF6106 family protein [Firmicutes bacterium]|nr:DUF6106 family protein [Bacillota bacterium]